MNENSLDPHISSELDYIEIQTGVDPAASIIWLHGLGADGHDFEPIVPELGLPTDIAFRFIFPHAPMRPITINNGMVMRGWYDIYHMPIEAGKPERADRPGLEHSSAIVRALTEQENQRGMATSNIFLAGFSQGGAIALFAGLRFPHPLAGIIALSAYLPDLNSIEAERSNANRHTPVFMAHGNHDPIIPMSAGRRSYEVLSEKGHTISWHIYDMPHSVHPDEIRDISRFVRQHSEN